MKPPVPFAALVVSALFLVLFLSVPAQAVHFSYDSNNVIIIDNTRKIFPLGITIPPPPTAVTPTGKSAYKEFADAGMLFMRTGMSSSWNAAGIALEKQYEDGAAKYGMFCQPWLRDLATQNNAANDAALTTVVNALKGNPGLGWWKGADEPWWGNSNGGSGYDVATQLHIYQLIKSLDSDHLVWIVQAPRGTATDLAPYTPTFDIGGVDIYPVSYPPGRHLTSTYPNHEISCVGDWTDTIVQATSNTKPIMMTLQIAFSGTAQPGRPLVFPTFHQERFMAYQAIIHGARALQFFGGTLASTLNTQDAAVGWNWTFWNNVLKRLFLEIGDKSALQPALVAPNYAGITGDNGVEFVTRQVGSNDIYIIACVREGPTDQSTLVTFSGIPAGYNSASVMYEEPASAAVQNGSFQYYFCPFDVHVFHLHNGAAAAQTVTATSNPTQGNSTAPETNDHGRGLSGWRGHSHRQSHR